MANPKQLAILKQGAKAWNEWRLKQAEYSSGLLQSGFGSIKMATANLQLLELANAKLAEADLVAADLSGAFLGGAGLSRAVMCGANLSGANLVQADLSLANLRCCDLRGAKLNGAILDLADLREAKLHRADLGGASLFRTNLEEADLKEADLGRAYLGDARLSHVDLSMADLSSCNLSRASVRRASFQRAIAFDTCFGGLDLSDVNGLEHVDHRGPSTIGIDTIVLSNGKIPEVFLRGCGVPDMLIEYTAALIGKPFDFYSCFLSYSSKDQTFVERLYSDLQSKGVRCWFAPDDMRIGDKIRPAIDESIRVYDKLVLILSEHSVASDWVEHEVETALAREQEQKRTMLFPIRLDDAVMDIKTGWPAHIKNTRHIGDFRHWKDHDAYRKAFARLLRDLKASDKQT